jgi:hypothetical protein
MLNVINLNVVMTNVVAPKKVECYNSFIVDLHKIICLKRCCHNRPNDHLPNEILPKRPHTKSTPTPSFVACGVGATTFSIKALVILELFATLNVNDNKHDEIHNNDNQLNDNQHNDNQHNDTQRNDTQPNDTQHNDTHSYNTHSNITWYGVPL